MSKLEKSYVGTQKDGAEFQIDDLEIFENVAYIMAYHADNRMAQNFRLMIWKSLKMWRISWHIMRITVYLLQ